MVAPVQSLDSTILDIHYDVVREVVAPTFRTRIGAGAVQVRRLYERPRYQFVIRGTHETKSQAEKFYSFAVFHQGDIPFDFDGKEWGSVETRLLVDFGNGSRVDFFLPNRRITGGTLTVWVNNVETAVTLTASSGLITFAVAPTDQHKIEAKYNCTYRCVFAEESEVLLNERNFYNKLFSYDGVRIMEMIP